jgi:signal transduction histidine kinase
MPVAISARALRPLDVENVDRVCHELRRPLAAATAFAELLQDGISGALNAEQAEQLAVIQQSLRRLDDKIADLYAVSEVLGGVVRVEPASIELESLLYGLAAEYEARCTELGVRLAVVTDGPLSHPETDAKLLAGALRRAIDNALIFGTPGNRVTVRLARAEGAVRVEVKDRGIGIPEAELEVVFDCFHRVERRSIASAEGIGIGLTVARGLMDALGGSVVARNRPMGGTALVFELPLPGETSVLEGAEKEGVAPSTP